MRTPRRLRHSAALAFFAPPKPAPADPEPPAQEPNPSLISDATWAALEAWRRTRDPYDTRSPYNWVAIPAGFATFRHVPLAKWERDHRFDHLQTDPSPAVRELEPDEIVLEPDPLGLAQD